MWICLQFFSPPKMFLSMKKIFHTEFVTKKNIFPTNFFTPQNFSHPQKAPPNSSHLPPYALAVVPLPSPVSTLTQQMLIKSF